MHSSKKLSLNIFLLISAVLIFLAMLFCPDNLLRTLSTVITLLLPFILGICIAFLFNRPVELFIKIFRLKNSVRARTLATILLIIALLGLTFLLSYPTLNSLSSSFSKLVGDIPKIYSKISSAVSDFLNKFGISVDPTSPQIMFQELSENPVDIAVKIYEAISKSLSRLSISFISAVYMVIYKNSLLRQLDKLLFALFDNKGYFLLIRVGMQTNKVFGGYFSGKLLQCLMIATFTFIAVCIMGSPYALLIAAIMGFFNIISFIGPVIGAVPCVILLYIDSPLNALWFIIITLILQLVISQILGPKMLGSSTGLPSFWVFFAVIAGAYIGGIMGMIIGIPIFAVIYIFIKEAINLRIRQKDSHEFERCHKKVYNRR